ncbi:MAG TPA: M20/M25/M40 family metallo-hydrolase [Phenylobacterium sp.]|nr:M20/M25/M40 family metallo-hydrolase [Phenylobacterium sp.]
MTPRPRSADAPVGVFSAGRAMTDDRVIARTPHPVGSAANARVRDYLVQRMQALGLAPQVQRTVAFQRSPRSAEPYVLGATVENIVGVLPGRDRNAPALAIMAHYDSVHGSPGAADDAAGVAAALEVMRVLKEDGIPARDVVLVLTDGEEAGLLGAEGFFRGSPMARHLGFVINLEARGGGGQTRMFETGKENGKVVKLFMASAVKPSASSLVVYLYEHMPNDTDFTVPKGMGLPGLNYAFIGRQFDYHSPTSTADNLDQGSLQHMGEQVLGSARAVANASALPGKAPNLVYSNTVGAHVLAYPQLAGWGVLLLIAGLGALGAWRAMQRGAFAWSDVARGVGAAVYLVLTSVALFRLARRATGAAFGFMEQRVLLAQAGVWEAALLLIGVGVVIYAAACAGRGSSRIQAALLAAVAGLAGLAFGLDVPGLVVGGAAAVVALFAFGKPSGVAGAWTGVMATALAVAVVAQTLAAPAAFLIAWPLAIAALLGAVSGMGAVRANWMSLLIAVPAAIGLHWVLNYAHGIYLGLDLVELLALFTWLSALLVWPLAHADSEGVRGPRIVALALILLGFITVAAVRLVPPWSPRHPQATHVTYVQDLDTGKASRVSRTPDLNPWGEQVLKADGGAIARRTFPTLNRRPMWAAPARPVSAQGPTLSLARQQDGSLLLTAAPPPGAVQLGLDIRVKGKVTETTVNGRLTPMLDKPGQWTRLRFEAVPQGIAVGFRAAAPGEIETRYSAVTEGWPAEARPLPPRDARTMAFDNSDSTTVIGSRRFSW